VCSLQRYNQILYISLSCPGAEFTQYLEVTFYPGEEQVRITQMAEGLGADNYLSLRTHIEGQVPFVPENTSVHIAPYKELYHYSSSGMSHALCIPFFFFFYPCLWFLLAVYMCPIWISPHKVVNAPGSWKWL